MEKALTLSLQVKGEVVSSNLPEFRQFVTDGLAKIQRKPSTDEEFGQAEDDVKRLVALQGSIVEAKTNALAEAQQLNKILSDLDEVTEEVREVRLALSKTITERKAKIKAETVIDYIDMFAERGDLTKTRARSIEPLLQEAIKRRTTTATMQKACEQVVVTKLGELAQSRELLREFVAQKESRRSLIADEAELELTDPRLLPEKLEQRLERARLQQEAAKAKQETEQAKAEVAAVKEEVAEASKPPKPPATTEGNPEQDEWRHFQQVLIDAFGPVKDEREKLTFASNQAKAAMIANALNAAWKEAKAS